MIYIDDYNSKAISNTPPKSTKKLVDKLKAMTNEKRKEQLNAFWQLVGITIAENYDDVKELLSRYGYKVVNEEDSAVAISDLWGKPKWMDFLNEISILIESTIDEKLVENILPQSDESSWIAAAISAVGSIAGGSLGLATSKKQADAAKETAKGQMISAIAQVNAEKQKQKTELAKVKAEETKMMYWIVGILIIVVAIIITVVIIKRRKQENK